MQGVKLYSLGGIILVGALVIFVCWYQGLVEKENKEEGPVATKATEKKIDNYKFDFEKAFNEMLILRRDTEENIFRELVNSLKLLTHASKEHYKRLAEISVGEIDSKDEEVRKKLKHIETKVKKINDEFFGVPDGYEQYLNIFFNVDFTRKGDGWTVVCPFGNLSLTYDHITIIDNIYEDNLLDMAEDPRRKLSEHKYTTNDIFKLSALEIVGNYFIGFVLH